MSALPLNKKTILVTRPGEAGEQLAAQLKEEGAETTIMPLIAIGEPDSWQNLDDAIKNIDAYDWLIFASANAVNSFNKRWQKKESIPKIATIGEATATAVAQCGLKANYCPNIFIAENFIEQFPGYPNLSQQRILWPRTNIGRELIAEKLQAAGAIVNEVQAYKTLLPKNAKELSVQLTGMINEKALDAITLASKETTKNLAHIISLNLGEKTPAQIAFILKDILLVTIGPQTSEGALNYLGKESLQAKSHTNEGMLAALLSHYQNQ